MEATTAHPSFTSEQYAAWRAEERVKALAALQRRADNLGRYYSMTIEVRRRGDSNAYRVWIEGVPTEVTWRTWAVTRNHLAFATTVAERRHAILVGQQMADERGAV